MINFYDAVTKQLENKNLIAKTGKSILVDATLIKSGNTKIKNKSSEQRDIDKVQSHNDKIEILLEQELNSKKPSKRKIKALIKAKEYNLKTLKNKEIDESENINLKDIQTSSDIIAKEKDNYNHNNKIDTHIRTGFKLLRKLTFKGIKHNWR